MSLRSALARTRGAHCGAALCRSPHDSRGSGHSNPAFAFIGRSPHRCCAPPDVAFRAPPTTPALIGETYCQGLDVTTRPPLSERGGNPTSRRWRRGIAVGARRSPAARWLRCGSDAVSWRSRRGSAVGGAAAVRRRGGRAVGSRRPSRQRAAPWERGGSSAARRSCRGSRVRIGISELVLCIVAASNGRCHSVTS
jgi:hypothetical protein